jgi:hypothetical protein
VPIVRHLNALLAAMKAPDMCGGAIVDSDRQRVTRLTAHQQETSSWLPDRLELGAVVRCHTAQ